MRRHRRKLTLSFLVALGIAALTLAGCRALMADPEPPEVRVVSLKIEALGVLEQQFRVGLELANPNPYPLHLARLRLALLLQDTELARGVGVEDVRLPADGATNVDVVVTTDVARTLGVFGDWLAGDRGAVRYALRGEATLAQRDLVLPFDGAGRIALED